MATLDEFGLNLKQRAFVDGFVSNGGNATQAALAAGYSSKSIPSYASVLQKDPRVLKAIDTLRPKPEPAKIKISKDDIIQRLLKEADEGETSNARTTALMGIAKIEGMIVDKNETKQVESFAEEIKAAQAKRAEFMVVPSIKTGT